MVLVLQESWLDDDVEETWSIADLRDVWAGEPAKPSSVKVGGSFDVELDPHASLLYVATLH